MNIRPCRLQGSSERCSLSSILGSTTCLPENLFTTIPRFLGFVSRFFTFLQDLAQVNTPSNVKMVSMSPPELAWNLAGVVYPADADEYPEKYVSGFREALSGHLTELQMKPRNARAMAARFIQTLLAKVWLRLGGSYAASVAC